MLNHYTQFLRLIFLGLCLLLHVAVYSQCECPGDVVDPVFTGDSLVTVSSCDLESLPYLTVTDDCDPEPTVTIDLDTLSTEYCGLHSVHSPICDYPSPWSLALFGLSMDHRYYLADQLGFRKYPDGTAHLYGTVFSPNNSNAIFYLDVWFHDAMNWTDWNDQVFPVSYKADCDGVAEEHENWTYYKMTPGSSATGMGDLAGSFLSLTHAPVNTYFGFQEGLGASNVSAGYGVGGWMNYAGMYVNAATGTNMTVNNSGDIAGETICCQSPEILVTYTAEDDCGNITIDTQVIEIRDNVSPALVNELPAAEPVICEEFQLWTPEWSDECSEVTESYIGPVIDTWHTAADGCGNASYVHYQAAVLPAITEECIWYGCMDPDAPQYDPAALFDDGSCFMEELEVIVFYDENEDGVMDETEQGIQHVEVLGSNYGMFTDAGGYATAGYNSNSTQNTVEVMWNETPWNMATTSSYFIVDGENAPEILFVGLSYDMPPVAQAEHGILPSTGICGNGDKQFFVTVTNTGVEPMTDAELVLTVPSQAIVTAAGWDFVQDGAQEFHLFPDLLAPGQTRTTWVTIQFPAGEFNIDQETSLEFSLSMDGVTSPTLYEIQGECSWEAQAQLFSMPVGEGDMHYVEDGQNIQFTAHYENESETVINEMSIVIPGGSFQTFTLADLVVSHPYTIWSDAMVYLELSDLDLQPGEELFLSYTMSSNQTTPGSALTHVVYFVPAEGALSASNSVILHINDCEQTELDIISTANGCTGDFVVAVSGNAFDDFQWTVNDDPQPTSAAVWTMQAQEPGTYVIHVLAQNEFCFSMDEIELEITDLTPEVEISTSETTFCEGMELTVEAESNFTDLNWYVNGQLAATGMSVSVMETAEVWVEAVSELCGTASDEIEITQLSPPQVVLEVNGPIEFCEGGNVTVTPACSEEEYVFIVNEEFVVLEEMIIDETTSLALQSTNECGEANASLEIVVHALPVAGFTVNEETQIVTAVSAVSYQWFVDGEAIEGATGQSYAYTETGDYTVEITDANGCADMSQAMLLTYVGIERNYLNGFYTYPNPAQDQITLVIPGEASGVLYYLRNALGQVILSGRCTTNTTTLNISRVAAGSYFLELPEASVCLQVLVE